MSYWSERKFLVTGGYGFLGTHVVSELEKLGAASIYRFSSLAYDLRDKNQTAALYREHKPDVVIHLAATVGGIGANLQQPGTFFYDNMAMGLNIIHEAWRSQIEKLVVVGTVCSYPKITVIPFDEQDLWEGYPEATNAPYGIAKKALLTMCQAYRQQYNLNAIYLIPTNLYGEYDNFDVETSHVIPALIRKFHEAKVHQLPQVVLWGTGEPTREFLYVKDAVQGILKATSSFNYSFPINLGSGDQISIKALAVTIAGLIGFEGNIIWDVSKPNGQPLRQVSTFRAEQYLNFKASTPLLEGLQKTIEWYLTSN